MAAFDVERLLSDARLVVEYATRVGRLPDDTLPKAVEAVERANAAGEPPDVASLLAALNNTIKAISPVTLLQLREGMSPFDDKGRHASHRLQIAVCAFTIVCACLIAYYTELVHKEQAVVQAVQQIQEAHPFDKLTALRKMAKVDKVLEKEDGREAEYHRALDELRTLQEKASASVSELQNLAQAAGLPLGDKVASLVQVLAHPGTANASPPAEPGANDSLTGYQSDGCDSQSADVLQVFEQYPAWLKAVILDIADLYCFSAKTNVGYFVFNVQPTWVLISKLQHRITLQTGWVLPALYGLLGASVFLMRGFTSVRIVDAGALSAIIRVALGGIAGIIIGWFWVPTSVRGADVAAVTSVPFALAFLAGFSIDILYSLLDRLNRSITDLSGQRSDGGAPPATRA
jgi:hypothetical protein